MDWLTGLQKAIDYIEDNITEKLIMKKLQGYHTHQALTFREPSAFLRV